MLRPEKAQKQLNRWRVRSVVARPLAAINTLQGELKTAALALIGRDDAGKALSWAKRAAAQPGAAQLLDVFSAEDRQRVFGCLLPKLAGAMEAAWQLLYDVPYQTDSEGNAFRSPEHPDVTRPGRLQWLLTLHEMLGPFDPDVVDVRWLAAWAPHLGYGAAAAGLLLAAVIDAGGRDGDAVFDILLESARNEHEVGAMGHHVTQGLLAASRPDGWEFIEKMLLAAQRQEGLRQVILETIDAAHPQAFRRMIKLILEHNLVRFSSVVRAVNVWLGLRWDSVSTGVVNKTLARLDAYLNDDHERRQALQQGDGESLYLALWSIAHGDAAKAVAPAQAVLGEKGVERRYAAVELLSRLCHPAAVPALRQAVDDPDLRVAVRAFDALPWGAEREELDAYNAAAEPAEERFALLQRLLARIPEKSSRGKPLVWPWAGTVVSGTQVADRLVDCLGKQSPTKLLPYLGRMSSSGRSWMAEKLGKLRTQAPQVRTALFSLAADRDSWVRQSAVQALKKSRLTAEEVPQAEAVLRRKDGEVRRAVLAMLQRLPEAERAASRQRLLTSDNANQRLAGLEMLRLRLDRNREIDTCRELARRFKEQRKKLIDEEADQVEYLLDLDREKVTLDNALGLLDPSQLTPVTPPKARKVRFITPAAVECLKALDALVHKHRHAAVVLEGDEEDEEQLLGNYGLPLFDPEKPIEENVRKLPLREVWEGWLKDRPKNQRDADGLELVRAAVWVDAAGWNWQEWRRLDKRAGLRPVLEALTGGEKPPRLKYESQVSELMGWLLYLHPPAGAVDYLLDATETAFALVPEEERARRPKKDSWLDDWRDLAPFTAWLSLTDDVLRPEWSDEQRRRRWRLLHWKDRPADGMPRQRPELEVLLDAYRLGEANEADVLDELLGPRDTTGWYGGHFDSLSELTGSNPPPLLKERPELQALLDRCRERIVQVELKRGDTPTPATGPARGLRSLCGLDTLMRLLAKVGKRGFRLAFWDEGKREVLTRLVSVTQPRPEDTPQAFGQRMDAALKEGVLPSARLIELAFVAPQWARHVGEFLGWDGFEEGLWWFFTHMTTVPPHFRDDPDEDNDFYDPDEADEADQAKRNAWHRLVSERTALSEEDRVDGAVDPGWFRRVHERLGSRRWEALAAAARFGGSAGSARKAVRLADVLRGKAKKSDLVRDIRQKNSREAVRLLGLLPLAGGDRRERDLLLRYRVLQGYRRYAKSLGPLSREGALRTAAIGLENLARTAGFVDPVRLEWAMEAREIADLAQGPVSHTVDGVTVTLALDDQARPELTVKRGERELKNVPPKTRKDRKVAALVERKADLRRQASRIRESLETSMCRGDAFTGAELRQLFEHPMLVPLLSRLVLLGEGIAGYPVREGRGLLRHTGKVEPVKADESLRIAHPHDLLTAGEWYLWQHECFAAERVQPFKQVFRELYVLTAQEKKDGTASHRYAGQQVNPTQAQALFGARAWGTRDGIQKTFHHVGLTASVGIRHGVGTPLDVEGWTIEDVTFRKRGEWDPVRLADVPPRVFSEVMRDLDLVVSVAHRGVDPEASASTVEMRAALLRETCELLKLGNVRFKSNHALVDGQLGNYSVHLGSAVVHRQPGGHLCIVPVPAQHRGRLFLPFADDDPRTAEVVSKVILLARDHEIQDPNLLDQIRATV